MQTLLRLMLAAQVVIRQRHGRLRQDPHLGLPILADKHAAQGFVAGIQRVEAALERRRIQFAVQAQRQRDMVSLADPAHLAQEPQPLLGKRQRQCAVTRSRHDGRRLRRPLPFQPLRQRLQHRRGEQRRQRQPPAGLLHPVGQLYRQQRMPAQGEEVIMTADAFNIQ
ncbi:hypothetical protein F0335_21775 [Serratia marcescens]|nr:hypothetical protein [Serratia marcescens]QKO37054.1 hypothetical protein F0335_21775 [Serratia marcescens]